MSQEAPRTKSSLSPDGDLHMVPRLDGRFKKPPPHKNRRKPSKAHLHQMAEGQSSGEYITVECVDLTPNDNMYNIYIASLGLRLWLYVSSLADEVDLVVSPNKGEALFLDDGAPSAPPLLSPRIYPELPPTSDSTGSDSPPMTTPLSTPRSQSDINMQRVRTGVGQRTIL